MTPNEASAPSADSPARTVIFRDLQLVQEPTPLLDAIRQRIPESEVLQPQRPGERGHAHPPILQEPGPFRGMKNSLYEGGIRVPFIARWQGRVKAGGVSDRLVAFWDFLPAAAELAGLPASPGIDGVCRSRPPCSAGPSPRPGYLYWELSNDQTIQAIRLDEWKGVRTSRGAPIALYRLTDDPVSRVIWPVRTRRLPRGSTP